jgi:hypothetical protein
LSRGATNHEDDEPWRTPIARKILDEGGVALQDNAGSRRGRSYASQSRVNAIAAGKAWTNRILRLTVTAP